MSGPPDLLAAWLCIENNCATGLANLEGRAS